MRGTRAIALAILAAGLTFPGRTEPAPSQGELADAIRVIVHDAIITYQQVEEFTAPYADQLRRQFRDEPMVLDQKINKALDDTLERLLENQLILHDFEASDQYKFPETVIDDQIREYIRRAYADDRVRFIKGLQAEGKTYEEFRREIRDQFIIGQMRGLHSASDLVVSPHKVEAYYVGHQEQFKVESEVKLRMIVLTNSPARGTNETRALAEEILAKIKDGAAFAEMATVYSEGSQRSQGGDWGWVEKSVLRKELADVAFQLKAGERSGVIETGGALYLMLVEDARPEHVKPLTEVRSQIEQDLLNQERDRLQKQWIERLRKKTFVRYF